MSKQKSAPLEAEKPTPLRRTRLWVQEVYVGPDRQRKKVPALTKTHCHDPIDEVMEALKGKRPNAPTLVIVRQVPRKERQKGDYEQLPLLNI